VKYVATMHTGFPVYDLRDYRANLPDGCDLAVLFGVALLCTLANNLQEAASEAGNCDGGSHSFGG